eukprot:SM000006S19500  [mRNA]  locus=s6:1137601:1138793:+ [translate_table: standard]
MAAVPEALVWRRAAAAPSQAAAEPSVVEAATGESANWVPVIPVEALPRGERRLVRQDGETILLLWYRDQIYALENTSPAEGAYSEGFINAKLTQGLRASELLGRGYIEGYHAWADASPTYVQDGAIVCPTTGTTYDLKTGAIREWYPTNPVLRVLTRPLREVETYPVKVDGESIYVDMRSNTSSDAAEVVIGSGAKVGQTASDVAVDETRMQVDESQQGFGFSRKNEIINGRAAMLGFFFLLVQELVTSKGFLSGTGFLDFIYRTVLPGGPLIK